MTDPTSPEVQAEVVQARQDAPSDGSTFTRVFSLNQSNVPDDSPMHGPNKDETVREALRRGLVPTGDATFTTEVQEFPSAVVITYTVPVEPTPGAVANSTSTPAPPASQPEAPEAPVEPVEPVTPPETPAEPDQPAQDAPSSEQTQQ